jgi:hypothetical protein
MLFYLCASRKCFQILRAHCTLRVRVVVFGLVPILLLEFSGKMAQRPDLPEMEIVQEPTRMEEMLHDTKIEISCVVPLKEHSMYVKYKQKVETQVDPKNTNVVIAAITTAYGRMELYKLLDILKENCFYLDTDSVIFSYRDGDTVPVTGNFLGMLTDEVMELGGPQSFIKRFCGGGSKCYAYEVEGADGSTKSICKARGLTINSSNFSNSSKHVVNFNT